MTGSQKSGPTHQETVQETASPFAIYRGNGLGPRRRRRIMRERMVSGGVQALVVAALTAFLVIRGKQTLAEASTVAVVYAAAMPFAFELSAMMGWERRPVRILVATSVGCVSGYALGSAIDGQALNTTLLAAVIVLVLALASTIGKLPKNWPTAKVRKVDEEMARGEEVMRRHGKKTWAEVPFAELLPTAQDVRNATPTELAEWEDEYRSMKAHVTDANATGKLPTGKFDEAMDGIRSLEVLIEAERRRRTAAVEQKSVAAAGGMEGVGHDRERSVGTRPEPGR